MYFIYVLSYFSHERTFLETSNPNWEGSGEFYKESVKVMNSQIKSMKIATFGLEIAFWEWKVIELKEVYLHSQEKK